MRVGEEPKQLRAAERSSGVGPPCEDLRALSVMAVYAREADPAPAPRRGPAAMTAGPASRGWTRFRAAQGYWFFISGRACA